ncbi:hypothetical protein Ocin01_04912 [Orchesella cincta]|uniref:Uncharacterized protein n=1 Tax=Orchesella cincta TaxID=48709 RepID=A0A1D2N9J7_ORCCI|nr:hypothetical protein Ocin01_04912 [Orchesella cincta]
MFGNNICCYLIYSCLLQAAFYYDSVNSKLYVIKEATHLKSSDFKYPTNNETLDVVWLFDHSIRLKVNDFHLDGHSGDFVLISDLPLLYADDFVNGTSDESYVSDLARSILTNQGLLLSWKVNKTIEAVNPRGTFVLFHTEANVPGSTASFEGFDIEVVNLDDARTTTTSTTPDPIIPERPDQQLYISKFLSCMHPIEFFNKTNIFKARIAQIATEYCSENNIPLQQGDITAQEVNIPGPNEGTYAGLHYCDSSWAVYNSCVEVTFSIVRVEDGDYVLPAGRLEEMWKQKSQDLIQYGYCPYIPLNELQDLNTVIFIAFFMGIIISLVALSIVVWIRTQSFLVFRNRRVAAGKVVEEEPPTQIKFYDPQNNPIYNFIPNTVKSYTPGSEMYPGGDYLGIGDDDLPPQLTRRSFTENPAFKDTHTEVEVYAFDNSGFEQDEGSARVPRSENEDADEFLIMPRVIPGSISDTEA